MEARIVLANSFAISVLRRSIKPWIACLIFLTLPALASAQPPRFARQQPRPQSRPPTSPNASQPFRVETEHFIVNASDRQLAQRVANEAEKFRKQLAIEWTGTELGPWQDKCPITVELGMHAGGETSFAFVTDPSGRSRPISWQMRIFGPPDRLLDAVLPHEITHTIFATHFGRPLPRWADEGACTTVEHESERIKNHHMLMDFLTAQPSRGIPFNRMFTMKDYPHDILPLYAQGYSLAKFLILQKGQRYFLDFVSSGMMTESPGNELRAWDAATEKFYGYRDLSELQVAWLGWVRNGSEAQSAVPQPAAVSVASFEAPIDVPSPSDSNLDNESWYAREMNASGSRVAANRKSLSSENAKATIWR